MSRSMHDRLKFTSEKDRELFCGLATPSDVRELVDTIERLQKERKHFQDEANALRIERDDLVDKSDAALAEIQELHQKTYDDLAAARAEVERLKGELGTAREASDRVIEHLNGRIEELQGQIELWKDMTGKARIETALRGTVGR